MHATPLFPPTTCLPVTHKCALTAVCVGCRETRPWALLARPRAAFLQDVRGKECRSEEREPGNGEGEARNIHGQLRGPLWEPGHDREIWPTERGIMSVLKAEVVTVCVRTNT